MTADAKNMDDELRRFSKVVRLVREMPDQDEDPKYAAIMDNLCTDTSQEAQDVRDIFWRMLDAEHRTAKG
ncbi:hypothetical protein JNM87_01010 [Candidatus Saccharibacteria bacterium]|nr:hypothetical protein [Candidatus Saccharibacteria bacterium]